MQDAIAAVREAVRCDAVRTDMLYGLESTVIHKQPWRMSHPLLGILHHRLQWGQSHGLGMGWAWVCGTVHGGVGS